MQVRIDCKNEKEWLEERKKHIGASDAAKIIGLSKWGTNVDLFLEKIGKKINNVSNASTELGHKVEPILRDLYSAYHLNTKIEYNQYTIIYQEDLPYIASTLDGEIEENGVKGVLEIKTANIYKSNWKDWQDAVPNHYYVQVLHQLISTGYDFVELYALLTQHNGEQTLKTYRFEREEHKEDIEWLMEEEKDFWNHVQSNQMPSLRIY